jgi:hypothetical protein
MKIACLFRGNLRQEDRTKDKFDFVTTTVSNTVFPEDAVDFFMHLWSDDPTQESNLYSHHFNQNCMMLEKNSDYHEQIQNVSGKRNTDGAFAQVSSSLSIQKVCRLFFDYCKDTNSQYDLVFITRPDMISTDKIQYEPLTDDIIYVNQHNIDIRHGDYCWLMTHQTTKVFYDIFDFLKANDQFSVSVHSWFYEYLHTVCGKTVKPCNLDVAVNCEIFKHWSSHPLVSNRFNGN